MALTQIFSTSRKEDNRQWDTIWKAKQTFRWATFVTNSYVPMAFLKNQIIEIKLAKVSSINSIHSIHADTHLNGEREWNEYKKKHTHLRKSGRKKHFGSQNVATNFFLWSKNKGTCSFMMAACQDEIVIVTLDKSFTSARDTADADADDWRVVVGQSTVKK